MKKKRKPKQNLVSYDEMMKHKKTLLDFDESQEKGEEDDMRDKEQND